MSGRARASGEPASVSPTPHSSLMVSSAWQVPMIPTSGAMTPFSAQLSASSLPSR
jgi:hypothetical protein